MSAVQEDRMERKGWPKALMAALSCAVLVAACVTASNEKSPESSPPVPSSSTPSPDITPTPTPSATPTPPADYPTDPPATPTPPLPKGPLPTVGPVPTGDWTSINWLAVPGGHSPSVRVRPDGNLNAFIEGWSKVYAEFVFDPRNRTLTAWSSADGLTWTSGGHLDISAWAGVFKEFDASKGDRDDCQMSPESFQEGPDTMLMSANVDCYGPGSCIAYPFVLRGDEGWWVSTDGMAWKPVDQVSDVRPPSITGSSTGYVVMDTQTGKARTSTDGRSWTPMVLPTLPAGSTMGVPVAMAGGYVLPVVLKVKAGHQSGGGGCAGDFKDLSKFQGAVYWSPDGKTWTRDSVNTGASYGFVNMYVMKIDDHTVVAHEEYGSAGFEWVSSDGKAWTQLNGSPVGSPYDQVNHIVAGRDHGLLAKASVAGYYSKISSISAFNSRLQLITLNQTGSEPWIDDWQMALGPTGLLVTNDGTRFWLGVPGNK